MIRVLVRLVVVLLGYHVMIMIVSTTVICLASDIVGTGKMWPGCSHVSDKWVQVYE